MRVDPTWKVSSFWINVVQFVSTSLFRRAQGRKSLIFYVLIWSCDHFEIKLTDVSCCCPERWQGRFCTIPLFGRSFMPRIRFSRVPPRKKSSFFLSRHNRSLEPFAHTSDHPCLRVELFPIDPLTEFHAAKHSLSWLHSAIFVCGWRTIFIHAPFSRLHIARSLSC